MPVPPAPNLTKDAPSSWITKPELSYQDQEEAGDWDVFLLETMAPDRPDIYRADAHFGLDIQSDNESMEPEEDLDTKISREMNENEQNEQSEQVKKEQQTGYQKLGPELEPQDLLEVRQEIERQQYMYEETNIEKHKKWQEQKGLDLEEEKAQLAPSLTLTKSSLLEAKTASSGSIASHLPVPKRKQMDILKTCVSFPWHSP
jgi:hypothetical protein